MYHFIPFSNPLEPIKDNEAMPIVMEALGETVLDTFDLKANGEWLAWGDACAPKGEEVVQLTVSVSVNDEAKSLLVTGKRMWSNERGKSIFASEPVPFERMPITPGNAFGGEGFEDNPAGIGFWPKKSSLDQYPLPILTYPDDMMLEPNDLIRPAYFGPRDVMLPERQKLAGTYDKAWAENWFPDLPEDFDLSFYQLAQEDQQLQGFFYGNETFQIKNMHEENSSQEFSLPGIRPRAFATINRKNAPQTFEEVIMHTDTVWLFPNHEIAVLIHRGRINVETMDLKEVESLLGAFEWLKDEPRESQYYQVIRDERTNFDDLDKMEEAFRNPQQLYPEKWIEPEDAISELIRPREGMLNKSQTPLIDAMWEKQKAALEEGLASQGMGSYDDIVEAGKKVLDDPEIKALTAEVDKLKSFGPADVAENLPKSSAKIREMVDNIVKKQADGMEIHFRKEAQFFGYDYDDLVAAGAAQAPKNPADVQSFVTAELQRIVSDTETPEEIKKAAQRALPEVSKLKPYEEPDALKELTKGAAAKVGHASPPADPATPAASADLQAELVAASNTDAEVEQKDFRGVDLSNINLYGLNLEHADFTSAKLCGTIFRNCILEKACFAHADMTGAKLLYCSANESNFGKATLDNTSFLYCKLHEANFTNTKGENPKFSFSLMEGALFSETKFTQPEFINSVLASSLSVDSTLASGWFNRALLENFSCINSDLSGSVFSDCTGRRVTLVGVKLEDADFSNCDLKQLSTLNDVCLDRSKFKNADLSEANFRGASLIDTDFSGGKLIKTDFSETNLSGAVMVRAFARESRFHRAQIKHADLSGADFMNGNFLLASIKNCKVDDANFFSADFMKAELDHVNFDKANVKRTKLKH